MAKDWYPPAGTRLGTTGSVIRTAPWLKHYFGIPELQSLFAPGIKGIVFWGGRSSAKLARRVSWFRRLPYWHIEDGYLRSIGLGKQNTLPISIVVDDLGMPVDVSRASRLEQLIASLAEINTAGSGADIREALVREKLSKYNNLPHRAPTLEATTRRRILLIDQVFGDVSVPMSGGSAASFSRMLDDAVASGGQCVVRTHPDVMAGFRKGYLTEKAAQTPGVILMDDAVSVASILSVVDEVWTVSSQFGLDAMLRGIPVRCYGAPFYSGWGLTEDRPDQPPGSSLARRAARPSMDQLVAATFSLYPSYRDPTDWREIDVFQAIETLAAERRAADLD